MTGMILLLLTLVAPPIRTTDPVEISPEPPGSGRFCVIKTSMGTIKVELFEKEAPESCKNFFRYVENRKYDNTVFHRVMKGFMIQGGGYEAGLNKATTAKEFEDKKRPVYKPIKNEASADRPNKRGTIAVARKSDGEDTGTNQFYFNVVDNTHLDVAPGAAGGGKGWCVFGKVVEGMDVVDKIADVSIKSLGSGLEHAPVEEVVIQSMRRTAK